MPLHLWEPANDAANPPEQLVIWCRIGAADCEANLPTVGTSHASPKPAALARKRSIRRVTHLTGGLSLPEIVVGDPVNNTTDPKHQDADRKHQCGSQYNDERVPSHGVRLLPNARGQAQPPETDVDERKTV